MKIHTSTITTVNIAVFADAAQGKSPRTAFTRVVNTAGIRSITTPIVVARGWCVWRIALTFGKER